MRTSNWQNIPIGIDLLMKVEPKNILDVSVGFGRWGMIVREFCDVRFDRVKPDEWEVYIEGIEAISTNISDYHSQFYNKINIGDAKELLPDLLKKKWNVVIFGDVLEHFTKEVGKELLGLSLRQSDYIFVDIPLDEEWPQIDRYGNVNNKPLSLWDIEEFSEFYLVRSLHFIDFMGRPLGSFILSKSDPKRLREKLIIENTDNKPYEKLERIDSLPPEYREVVNEGYMAKAELKRMEESILYSWLRWFEHTTLYRILKKTYKYFKNISLNNKIKKIINPIQDNEGEILYRAAKGFRLKEKKIRYSDEQADWIEKVIRDSPPAIGIIHSEWLGIKSSTQNQMKHILEIPNNITSSEAKFFANLILETDQKKVVFSGLPYKSEKIIKYLNKLKSDIQIYILWHGNFMASRDDKTWHGFKTIIKLAKQGFVIKIGFTKSGMANVINNKVGIPSAFVLNYIDQIPSGPSIPLNGGPHIGIWNAWPDNWQKNPFAMLAAASLVDRVIIHGSGANSRVYEFANLLNIKHSNLKKQIVPQREMRNKLGQMHLNLYITLSETAPMVPLESLSVGTPCLTGPNSHLFEDDIYLKERLVVPYPDRSEIIYSYIKMALKEREEIVQRYQNYAFAYNARAKKSFEKFIDS